LTVTLKTVWRSADATTERDVLAFWREHKLLPADVNLADRLKDICVVAYDGERVIGVSEASLSYLERVRARVAMHKASVAPDRRRENIAVSMQQAFRQTVEEWSKAHPEEKVMAVASIVATRNLGDLGRKPVFPRAQMTLIGYTSQGEQIRIGWFEHAEVEY
jgi:hypothetical protein